MLSDAILETTLMRLAINFSKFFKKGEKESYGNLFREYFPHVTDDDWIRAVESYIRNPSHRGMPKVSDLQAVLPLREMPESTPCNACHKGLRSIAEKSQFGYWQSVAYACTCEAGKRYTAHASWQCTGCSAFVPFELPSGKPNRNDSELLKSEAYRIYQETKQMSPVCRAYNFHSYDVNCTRWKKRLAKEAEIEKPLNISRISQGEPDIEESQIPF